MKRVCILLFSGTGMTRYVACKIKTELEKQKNQVDIFHIEKTLIQHIPLNSYDMLGIAYPVHSLNAPKIVINFAKQLPNTESMNAFVINTVGGQSNFNLASSELLIRVLTKKGYDVFYDKQFLMPSNFIVKNKEDEVKRLIETVNAEIPRTAQEILNRVPLRQPGKFSAKLTAFVGRLELPGAGSMAAFYYTDKNCIRCGTCERNCPNNNIAVDTKKVRFKRKCGLCMRCFYMCPKNSICVRKPFAFIKLKSWYENEEFKI